MQGFRLYDYNKNSILKPDEDWMFLMTDRGTVLNFNSRTGDITPFPHRAMGIELQPLICYHEGTPLFAGDAVQRTYGNPYRFIEIMYDEDTGEVKFVGHDTGKAYRYSDLRTEISGIMNCVEYCRWKNAHK